MYSQSFPAVVKVGSAHAGMGKMKVSDHHAMDDVKSLVMMTEGKYLTAEPFIEGSYDIRLQKIGTHMRAFKRTSMSGDWKSTPSFAVARSSSLHCRSPRALARRLRIARSLSRALLFSLSLSTANTGSSMCDVIPLTAEYKRWLTEAGKLFGGLHICTVDAIHDSTTGRELIMEVNGTSSGLFPGEIASEDNIHIMELVLAEAELLEAAEAAAAAREAAETQTSPASGGGDGTTHQ